MNYYLTFITSDIELYNRWDDTAIETTANLVVGDLINFRNENFVENLEKDFGTREFLITKRIFLLDSDFEDVGGVFRLFLIAPPGDSQPLSIEQTNLSDLTINKLKSYEINTVEQLLNLSKEDLKKYRNIGKNSQKEIEEFKKKFI